MLIKLANSMFNVTSKVKAESPGVNLDNRYITNHPESLGMWKVVPTVCFFFFQVNYWTHCLNLKVPHLKQSLKVKEKPIEHIF